MKPDDDVKGAMFMPFAVVGGVRLFYTDEGTGPPVLLVHGWTCDSHDWSWQIPALARQHRVIAVDLRGHGHSAVPDSGYTPRSFAADLAQLLTVLDARPVVAVGHSLGATIVSTLAVQSPEFVRAVVVVDPSYAVADDLRPLIDQALEGLRGPATHDVAVASLASLESDSTPAGLATWHRRRALAVPRHVVHETFLGMFDPDEQVGFQTEAYDYLTRRNCPVLAIWTDAERAAWDAKTHHDPHCRSLAWTDCGHWLHQERPDEFNALVLDWIAGLSA